MKAMNKEYPDNYASFRHRANILIGNAEMLAQRMGDQSASEPAKEVARPEPKTDKAYHKTTTYRALGSFKPFDSGLEVKLLEVLTMNPAHVYNAVKGRMKFPPAKPMYVHPSHLNPNKYCYYHASNGHNTENCHDLQKKLSKLYEQGKLKGFVKTKAEQDAPANHTAPNVKQANHVAPGPRTPPIPNRNEKRVIHMIDPTGGPIGGMLPAISLSN